MQRLETAAIPATLPRVKVPRYAASLDFEALWREFPPPDEYFVSAYHRSADEIRRRKSRHPQTRRMQSRCVRGKVGVWNPLESLNHAVCVTRWLSGILESPQSRRVRDKVGVWNPRRVRDKVAVWNPLQRECLESLSLLDRACRQLEAVSRGTIPARLAPILGRLGVNNAEWIEATVRQFGRWLFKKTAAARRDSLAPLAARSGKAWCSRDAPG